MDRRKFLRFIPAVITAGVIAPKLLIPEVPVKPLILKNQLSMIRKNYIIGCDPVSSEYTNGMGIIIIKKRRGGYSYLYQNMKTKTSHEEMLKFIYDHYRDRTFFEMKP